MYIYIYMYINYQLPIISLETERLKEDDIDNEAMSDE